MKGEDAPFFQDCIGRVFTALVAGSSKFRDNAHLRNVEEPGECADAHCSSQTTNLKTCGFGFFYGKCVSSLADPCAPIPGSVSAASMSRRTRPNYSAVVFHNVALFS